MHSLTDTERTMLDFERTWEHHKHPGAKEAAIRDTFDISPTRYYQLKNALIDRPEAWAHDAQLVKRLRRLRDERKKARTTH